jgi:YgiT-type zinc finger domain-containing protein
MPVADRCEYCGERLFRERSDVYRRRGNRHVLFKDVPALVCRACGHREFAADAVERMEQRLNEVHAHGRKATLLVVSA